MAKDITKTQIVNIIDAIVEQTQIIYNNDGIVPQLQIDLVKKNILELYEAYNYLDKNNRIKAEEIEEITFSQKVKNEVTKKKETKVENIIDEEVAKVDVEIEQAKEELTEVSEELFDKFEEKVEKVETDDEIQDEVVEEIDVIEKVEEIHGEVKVEEEVKELPKEVKHKAKQVDNNVTIAEKFQEEKKTINDTIEKTEDNTLAAKLQKAPISDLVKAIGINDKFLFINELFGGNADEYNTAIKELNQIEKLHLAFDYLDNLRKKHNWDESSTPCLKIYDLVRRKYQVKR